MENKKSKKLIITIVSILVAAVVIMGVLFSIFKLKPTSGSKSITIEVVDNAGNSKVYNVKTDAEFLRQAMEETKGLEFSGTESEYGLMVETVNGVTAIYAEDGSYWSFYVNDEYCNYGVDAQPVYDQDSFKIVYDKFE